MGRKRVLVLLPGGRVFGQETALINLGLMLRDEDIDLEYLTHDRWGEAVLAPSLIAAGFRIFPIPLGTIWGYRTIFLNPLNLFWNLWSVYKCSRFLKRNIDVSTYDAVLLCNIPFSIFILGAVVRSGVPTILRYGDEPPGGNAIYRYISRKVMGAVDIHVANCHFLARLIGERHGVASVRVIHNFPFGLNGGLGAVTPISGQGAGGDNYLTYIGQLSEHKGLDILLDAFDILAPRFPALRLVVAGELPGVMQRASPMLGRIERSKRDWGDRVRFAGYVSDVRSLLGAGAIHLLPSVWDEPSPNVVFEAKACGVPSVVFARGGVPELIRHGVDGYLCDGEDVESLVEGIVHFLVDPAAYARAATEARLSLETTFSERNYRSKWRDVMTDAFALGAVPADVV